jgi:hypothetical protein
VIPRRPRRRRAAPTRAGDALSGAMGTLQKMAPAEESELFVRWEAAVGPRVAARAEPISLRHGVLIVAVASSAWLQELSFLRDELKTRLNAVAKKGLVSEVRLVLTREERRPVQNVAEPVSRPPVDLTPFQDVLDGVLDPDLRRQIGSTLARCLSTQQEDDSQPATDTKTPAASEKNSGRAHCKLAFGEGE